MTLQPKQLLFWASALVMPSMAHAVSSQTAQIFNKENRELEPPPKTLRANSEEASLRFREGSSRIARKVAKNDESEASASLEPSTIEIPETRTVTAPYDGAYTRPRSTARRKSNGYSGDRFFGLGFMAAGAYGIFGAEVDFTLAPDWSAGFGLGTGMSYNTWAAHARHFFMRGRWSPMLEAGYAQWSVGKIPANKEGVMPGYLSQRFFENADGQIPTARSAYLLYPGIGVLYQHESGLAGIMELQYFVNASDFSGALYGTFGMYYFF
ncbi:MAG: hypothetical protein JST16_15010 [Bdellovibrionales bacterium]|nr:hypothetical protein [Bdellovibrionales bacterium]